MSNQLAIALDQAELYAQSQNSTRLAEEKATQLQVALQELQQAQTQLIQTEKMSSLGQMVAGIADEINNPTSFIYSLLVTKLSRSMAVNCSVFLLLVRGQNS